jgi:lysophospholipase L1-like esterase
MNLILFNSNFLPLHKMNPNNLLICTHRSFYFTFSQVFLRCMFFALTAVMAQLSAVAQEPQKQPQEKWAACWASAMQGAYKYSAPVSLNDPSHLYLINPDLRFAFPNASTEGASNQTIRLIVKPDLYGNEYRLRFSNFFGTRNVTFNAVTVGVQDYAGNVIPGTIRRVRFNGSSQLSVRPGQLIYSDGIQSPADPADPLLRGKNFVVSFAVAGSTGPMTYHGLGLETSYVSAPNSGDHTGDIHDAAFPNSTTEVFFLDELDVQASTDTAVVCVFGASIEDGQSSTINGNDRWSNDLSRRLHEVYGDKVSVVNEGIAGNTVVNPTGTGPAAVDRLGRDVLGLSGVTSVVWMEGINDFGLNNNTPAAVIAGYENGISRFHNAGLKVIGGTITTSLGCKTLSNWGTTTTDSKRRITNDFIRHSGLYDSVADLDSATIDPITGELKPEFVPDSSIGSPGDKLHPNRAGYQAMANTVDLSAVR